MTCPTSVFHLREDLGARHASTGRGSSQCNKKRAPEHCRKIARMAHPDSSETDAPYPDKQGFEVFAAFATKPRFPGSKDVLLHSMIIGSRSAVAAQWGRRVKHLACQSCVWEATCAAMRSCLTSAEDSRFDGGEQQVD